MSFTQSAMEVMMVNVRAVLVVGVLGLAACGADGAAPSGQGGDREPVILSTTSIWGDVTAALACEGGVDVEVLLPEGADPHAYEASLADRALMDGADLLIINGLDLEEGLIDSIEAAASGGVPVFAAGDHVDVRGYGTTDSHEEAEQGHADEHEHGHGTFDPHIWLDPQLAVRQVNTIRDGLIQADPSCKDGYERRAAAYVKQLQELDQQLAQQLAPYQGRSVVSFHEALGYFVKRYGLNSEALVALPEDQPTPADVKRISAVLQAADVHGLLSEPGGGSAVLQALASDLKLRLEVFDPLELVPADAQRTPELYLQVMRQNGDAVAATFQP